MRWCVGMMVAHMTIVGCIEQSTETAIHCRAYRYNGHYVSEIKTKEIFSVRFKYFRTDKMSLDRDKVNT